MKLVNISIRLKKSVKNYKKERKLFFFTLIFEVRTHVVASRTKTYYNDITLKKVRNVGGWSGYGV